MGDKIKRERYVIPKIKDNYYALWQNVFEVKPIFDTNRQTGKNQLQVRTSQYVVYDWLLQLTTK